MHLGYCSITTLPLECITYMWKFYYDIHNPKIVSLKTFIRKNPVGKKTDQRKKEYSEHISPPEVNICLEIGTFQSCVPNIRIALTGVTL